MATPSRPDSLYSAFLSIPTELRCQIYDYLLVDSQAITVSAAYITVFGNRIQDRARKHDVPGLPLDLTPIVRQKRDASLLSVTNPAEVAIDNDCMASIEQDCSTLGMPAPLALLLTCHLVNDELNDYMRGKKQIKAARAQSVASGADTGNAIAEDDNEGLSLYVTYPYGVLILKNMYPYLLKQARRVYLSGYYTSQKTVEPGSPTLSSDESSDERLTPTSSFAVASASFSTAPQAPGLSQSQSFLSRSMVSNKRRRTSADNTARTRLRLDMPTPRQQRRASDLEVAFPLYSDITSALATLALTTMIRTLFPPEGTQQCTKLSSRILYPGQNAYSYVWADKHSPITHILRNVCGGKFDMRVLRSDPGVGLYTTVTPKPDGRIVSTSWENWRTAQRGRSRLGVGELDAFLRADAQEKVV
ncbi:hypothetical protein IQ06DRAFT_292432 [Phaeosphaeriaceae sp. SRC1lsM3a]|nr:hypothetical protein IQ06DRAFT_292432 [Stagonospora sp. SRC1lsM3a]